MKKRRSTTRLSRGRPRSRTRSAAAAGASGGPASAIAAAGDPPGPGLRIGCGADVHPLAPGRSLVLGGVPIPHDRGLQGHSDADVLTHAVCDAILGALGLPDLGRRFPDTDETLKGRSSLSFLGDILNEMRARGFEIVNLDSVVLAEAPRLQPHLDAMRERIAAALDCHPSRVSVKAKRFEGLGMIGRREGVMAQAVVLLGPAASRRGPGAGQGPRA
ncbi:MAG TPA: 2-C-methyl-D-erythritol 2,4-cyclodiphosphate synthase [Candidatus Polarisedimenticolia bacterium]